MIKSWFTCRISFQKLDESGHEIKATESYLVDAYTYTEAEARITHLMTQQIRGSFQVVNITKNNFSEVVDFDDSDMWFKVKVALIGFDENSGKEKQSNQYILISANDVQDAYLKTQDVFKGTVSGFVIPAVTYTKIIDVFPWTSEEEQNMEIADRGLTPMAEFTGDLENNAQVDEETGEVV